MSNTLDPDQARQFVGPDLGPNCLPRLSADDTGRQRVLNTWLLYTLNPFLVWVLNIGNCQDESLFISCQFCYNIGTD